MRKKINLKERKARKRCLTRKKPAPKARQILDLSHIKADTPESQVISELEKQIYDYKQMLEISKSFCSNLKLSSLIESILYIAMAQMRAIGAGLFIQESFDSTSFHLSNNYSGFEIDPSVDYTVPQSSPLVALLTSVKKAWTLPEIKSRIPDCKELDCLEVLKPSLIIPLMLKSHLNGILFVSERIVVEGMETDYTSYEKTEIITIADLASVAVHNASLIEQSSIDLMTHLKLKYYFYNYLVDKLDNSLSQSQPLSVIMFDIDFFKKFNDSFGHACGDYVLKTVAQLIMDNIRGEDMASRYGGEEFTVLLVNTTAGDACHVAERIRKKIESHDFFYDGIHMKVTISGGISEFSANPDIPMVSAKELVDQADKALYLSKRNGRNRISLSDNCDLTDAFK